MAPRPLPYRIDFNGMQIRTLQELVELLPKIFANIDEDLQFVYEDVAAASTAITNVGAAGNSTTVGSPIPGADGADGEDGAMGAPGVPGSAGAAGATGAIGAPGLFVPGTDGADGEDGMPGPPGPVGATGPQGPSGSGSGGMGPPGPEGESSDETYPLIQILSTPLPSFRSKAFNSAVQAINTGAQTTLTFDSNAYDVGGVHSTSVNTSRFTVPAGGKGLWTLQATITIGSFNTTVRCQMLLLKNGATFNIGQDLTVTLSGTNLSLQLFAMDVAADGDFYEFAITQVSGVNVNTANAVTSTYGSAARVQST